ncbi:hypothetical protein [Peterkaempfera sp. SMS 1(5)a]|uniref:hypothetical protein n=1 Tax=Peterkaempfera podocarpi TaxID=3232308 RepID=UPI00367052E7
MPQISIFPRLAAAQRENGRLRQRIRGLQHDIWDAQTGARNLARRCRRTTDQADGLRQQRDSARNTAVTLEQENARLGQRLARMTRAYAVLRTSQPATEPVHDELWSLLDWSLFGSGMGDTFREALADTMTAAITPEQRAQALKLIDWWTNERGRKPVGRWEYERQQRRLTRAVRACARYRAELSAREVTR